MTSCTRSVFIEATYVCSLDALSLERDALTVGSAMRARMAISKARMTCSMNVKALEGIAIAPAWRLQPCTALLYRAPRATFRRAGGPKSGGHTSGCRITLVRRTEAGHGYCLGCYIFDREGCREPDACRQRVP